MADDRLNFDTRLNSSGFENGIQDLESQAERGMQAVSESGETHMQIFQTAVSAAIGAATAMFAELGGKALESAKGIITAGDEYNKSVNQLSASTGKTAEELKGLEETAQKVYKNNFGESFDDVAVAISDVSNRTGLIGDELQEATENAFTLSSTFGMEVGESTKAAASLMKNFGISASEAYNIIAVGAQNGANQNDDLLDTLNEYSAQYSALGLSADEFVQSLVNGAETGVFSIDKVGDAVKEFNIRAKDGSDSSAQGFELIGMNAEEMTSRFAQGGDTAKRAFFEVVNALNQMSDPVEKNTAAVNLFGTMYEDLESDLLPILSGIQDTSSVTYDALGQINEVKYNDISHAVEGLKRIFSTAAMNIQSEVSGRIAGAIGGLITTINNSGGDYSKIFDGLISAGKEAISAFEPVINNYKNKAGMIIRAISDGIKNNLPTIKKKATEIAEKLISGFLESRKKLIDTATAMISKLAAGLASGSSKLKETAGMLISELLRSLSSLSGEIFTSASQIASTLISGIKQHIPQLVSVVSQIANTIITTIQQLLPQIVPIAIEIIPSLINGILSVLPLLMEIVPSIMFTLINGILTYLPAVVDCAVKILMTLVTGIVENVTMLLSVAITVITTLVSLILDNLPLLIECAVKIVIAVVEGILQNLSPLLEVAVTLIMEIVNALLQNLEPLMEAAIQMILAIIQGISESLPLLIECAVKIISSIVNGLAENLPKILECAVKIIVQLAAGLAENLPKLVEVVPQIAKAIIDALLEVDWIGLGINILKGIADGLIEGVSAISDTISAVATDIVEGFKNFFGIHSPSTLFRDKIGKFLPQGIAVGVKAEIPSSFKDIDADLKTAVDRMQPEMQLEEQINQKVSSEFLPIPQNDSIMSEIDFDTIFSELQAVTLSQGAGAVPAYSPVYQTIQEYNNETVQSSQNNIQEQRTGDIIIPVSLFKNSDILDTIVVNSAMRANSITGGRSI